MHSRCCTSQTLTSAPPACCCPSACQRSRHGLVRRWGRLLGCRAAAAWARPVLCGAADAHSVNPSSRCRGFKAALALPAAGGAAAGPSRRAAAAACPPQSLAAIPPPPFPRHPSFPHPPPHPPTHAHTHAHILPPRRHPPPAPAHPAVPGGLTHTHLHTRTPSSHPADAHPRHLPILLYMEVKGAGQLEGGLGDALLAVLQGSLDRATAPGPDRCGGEGKWMQVYFQICTSCG